MPDNWDFSKPQKRANALSETPLLTWLLFGLSGIITLAYHTAGENSSPFWQRLGAFGVVPLHHIWEGQYYALLTCVFVHGSFFHLLFNMLWLLRLGAILEFTLPIWAYVLFMVTAAFFGSTAQIVFSDQTGIGFSGVVYAMFGLMWAGRGKFPAWRALATRDNLNLFIGWGVLCVITTWMGVMNVANAAHAAGMIFGLSVGWLFYSPRRRPVWALPLVGLAALSVIALTWMPWSPTWNFWKGNREFERKHYASAIQWYQRSLNRGVAPDAAWDNISAAWNNIAFDAQQRGDMKTMRSAMAQADSAQEQANQAQKQQQAEEQRDNQSPGSQMPTLDDLKARASQNKSAPSK